MSLPEGMFFGDEEVLVAVSGIPLSKDQIVPLESGQKIDLGDCSYVVEID